VRVLQRHARRDDFLENLLDAELARAGLSAPNRRLVQELTFGVVRWQATLDWLIAQKTQGRTQKALLQCLLRLGLYQMFWLDRIPDHAVVNETVALAKRGGLGRQAGFVNAVLRGYLREREPTQARLDALKTQQPALGYSHPEWLCERWQQRWGADRLRHLLDWNNTPPISYARVNTLRTDATRLTAQWKQEGVAFVPRQWDWTGHGLVFELQAHAPLTALPSFRQGLFYVQDPSTLLAVRELNPQPGERVLDLCAAPGGKTTFIAQLMQDRGLVVAQDPQRQRRQMIRENCERLGVTCVRLAPASSAGPGEAPASFDRVLVDVPCSNTGVMRRRVDLRWRLRSTELQRLQTTQQGLLRLAAAQLRPAGTLVYSTCSLEPEENAEVVRQFLRENGAFKLAGERELLPFVEGVDGAFVARLVRA